MRLWKVGRDGTCPYVKHSVAPPVRGYLMSTSDEKKRPDTDNADKKKKASELKIRPYPWYSPRFWHGMRLGTWLSLVADNGFRVHPMKYGLLATITGVTAGNSLAYQAQNLIYGRNIREVKLEHPPVFILGHWRSGTTYLHELMSFDERFCSPTNYQCYAPNHFLISEGLITKMFWFLLPSKRPMDNVALGWSKPQEDEFALCNMGVPSPYHRVAFPRTGNAHMDYIDMEGLTEAELDQWRAALDKFVRMIAVRYENKRIVLKSPPHTGRLGVLAKMYPGAKFVHITRDPMSLYSSTRHLWRSLDKVQGMQYHTEEGMEEYVFECLNRMYEGFWQQREKIDPSRIIDVRYEDVAARPVEEVERIYETLDLGDFEQVRPKLTDYAESKKDYKTNQHKLDEETVQKIEKHWAKYKERYGY